MRDDRDDGDAAHTVPTVPPPPGEDDVYDAATRVGGLSPEALATLRQLRDEKPISTTPADDSNVPVFLEDDLASEPKVRPAPRVPSVPAEPTVVVEPEPSPPMPTFTASKTAPAPKDVAPTDVAPTDDEPPPSYVAVFGPLSSATPEAEVPAEPGTPLLSPAVVAIAFAVILAVTAGVMARLGLLPFQHRAPSPPVPTSAPP